MNILERIDSALNEAQRPKKTPFKEHYPVFREAPREPVIVDMTEQAFRMAALRNSRGPCAGWDDYIAGRDYQPPMYFNSNVPVGPEDTGKHGIMSPQEGDKIQFDGPNPFSRRHANIRPWAPGEMLMTMMTVVDPDGKGNNPADGLLHQVATKGIVKRAAEATHGKYDRYDVDYSMQQGAVAIIQALPGDESRLGTRFTSFVGDYIQQAMKAGLPAGYQDEYRKIRGLRRRVIPLIKSALRNAMDGEPLSTDEQRIRREFATINYCTRCKGTGLVRNPQKAAAPDDEDIPEGIPCPQCDKDASGKSTGRIKEPGPKHP